MSGRAVQRRVIAIGGGFAAPIVLLAIWSIASSRGWLTDQILPPPSVVLETFREFAASGELLDATLVSLRRVALGYAAGALAGLLAGAVLGLSARLRGFFNPTFLALAQVPLIAWMPLLILIAGIDDPFKIILIAWATFVPMVLNVTQGMSDVPIGLREVGRVLVFDPWSMFSRIVLPAAAPAIFTGLREGMANAWQTLVVVELFASAEGLGYLMSWGRQLFQLDLVLAVVVVLGVIGFAINWSLGSLEGRLGRWRVEPR